MSINKKWTIVSAVVVSSVLLTGCGLFGGDEKEQIDPPQSVTYTEDGEVITEETAGAGEEVEEVSSLQTELYLVDKNGYVVPQTLQLPETNSVATQALEYLVENGPVTDLLPNDFKAVLPADTKLSVNVKDGVATVDFSKEFQNYQPEDEMRILDSITWTLTQFDTIDEVKLTLNGNEMTEMPVNGTPIGESLTRASGINLDASDVIDITNTKPVTVYYLGGAEDNYYYVPVTKRISNETDDNVVAVVNELADGPNYGSNLLMDMNNDVQLLDEPKVENGTVTLNFNEAIYSTFDDEEKMISQHLMNALVLSLTEQKGVESVAITVNGEAGFSNENGEIITEPVTRPEKVNTGSF
ncbi:GerMN domain-containing protein [Bacillus mesophilum]|uniref:Sporulation protein n=1 Tax=Bacillus mesophilum TaxID=1071718 RepID=A0A7V7RNQ0_9BACI|nr:GerMN domain-containing protein [Bacillus mesophilum]KAB2334139.1 sporulation protein [Bacillus mesophilum]